jgi:hypothetical protein
MLISGLASLAFVIMGRAFYRYAIVPDWAIRHENITVEYREDAMCDLCGKVSHNERVVIIKNDRDPETVVCLRCF